MSHHLTLHITVLHQYIHDYERCDSHSNKYTYLAAYHNNSTREDGERHSRASSNHSEDENDYVDHTGEIKLKTDLY